MTAGPVMLALADFQRLQLLGATPSEVYTRWWARVTGTPKPSIPSDSFRHHATRWWQPEVLTVLSRCPDGSLVGLDAAGIVHYVASGTYLSKAKERVVECRRMREWITPGFLWRQSRMPGSPVLQRSQVRVYVPSPPWRTERLRLFNDVTEALIC